jgi:hypothetical protein
MGREDEALWKYLMVNWCKSFITDVVRVFYRGRFVLSADV